MRSGRAEKPGSSKCALLSPTGVGPPRVQLGSTVSKPCPKAPYKKNSASRYSKFKGNSKRSTSDCVTDEEPSSWWWSKIDSDEQDSGRGMRKAAMAVAVVA
ncbi:hypothetical protein DVH24_025334 [Malus domestica]|uniref:Uncharacterized protein n=1 Tax=Malus domestica TaxID=3750 RepID=A0A498HSH7_MALDO|nr:hypothetical protein DVH24_025334 [Malus domestica]